MSLFRMPSLGADMEDGTLVEWLKNTGDKVARGDIIAVVETQKGAIEIEVFEAGILSKILVQPGTKVPVGTPLAELNGGVEALRAVPLPVSPPAPVSSPTLTAPIPPRRPASHEGVAALKASPAARKLAADHGLDLTTITGSGPEGAIVFVDVEHALKRQPASAQDRPAAGLAKKPARGIDLSEMRKAIAAAMSRSKREIPHYYLSQEVNLAPAHGWLAHVNVSRAPADRLLIGALYIKAVALALRALPEFNGFYADGSFKSSQAVHVGMAIALRGGGLVAPAIHDADTLSVDQIMVKLRDLVSRVRAGRMRGSELTDPTITISSLGDRGVGALYGVIYPPQVALVGIGTPQQRVWVVDGNIAISPVVTLTLAADHRTSDGHRGALFLAKITDLLQSPEAL